MRLLIVGCEYAGKTTLVRRISRWMIDFSLDTGGASPDDVFASFHRQVEPYLTDADWRRQATCRARQRS